MPIGDLATRDVVIAGKETTIQEAAELMRRHHVGDLVVVHENGRRVPLGIVTDRDIAVSIVATNVDPKVFTIGDLLTDDVVSVTENTGIYESIQRMRQHGVRRLPVVSQTGDLIGIVSVDDLIELLAEEMNGLAKLISRERARELQMKH